MGRQTLRLVMVLGALVTLLGGTGIFAVFNDQAVGGLNSAQSGSRLSAADLMIAPATLTTGNVVCGTFGEGTSTPQITVSDLQPSSTVTAVGYACLRNVGAASLLLTVAATGVRDLDTACTGDEAASGDATCGDNLEGELSPVLRAYIDVVNCTGATVLSGRQSTIGDLETTPQSVGTAPLAPGAPICIKLSVEYPTTTPEATIQVAQSDRVDWFFVFEGVAQ